LVWLSVLSTIHRERIERWTRVSIVAVLCCAILGGTLGFPAPRRVAKDRSKPFPCQDRACGCMNAASCWKSCCCHTNAQKVAWAKQHGVTPPAFVVAAAKREACTGGKCCVAKQSLRAKNTGPAKAGTPTTELALVTIGDYRQCQGLPPLWVLLSETTVPAADRIEVSEPAAGEWLSIFSESQASVSDAPDAPPPKA
jgi:hypothetical protein